MALTRYVVDLVVYKPYSARIEVNATDLDDLRVKVGQASQDQHLEMKPVACEELPHDMTSIVVLEEEPVH